MDITDADQDHAMIRRQPATEYVPNIEPDDEPVRWTRRDNLPLVHPAHEEVAEPREAEPLSAPDNSNEPVTHSDDKMHLQPITITMVVSKYHPPLKPKILAEQT
jgi:hypothetical protein